MNDLLYLPALRGATKVLPLELFTGGKKVEEVRRMEVRNGCYFSTSKVYSLQIYPFLGMNCFIAV